MALLLKFWHFDITKINMLSTMMKLGPLEECEMALPLQVKTKCGF